MHRFDRATSNPLKEGPCGFAATFLAASIRLRRRPRPRKAGVLVYWNAGPPASATAEALREGALEAFCDAISPFAFASF